MHGHLSSVPSTSPPPPAPSFALCYSKGLIFCMIRPPPVQSLALGPRTACDTLSISTGVFLAESHHNEMEEASKNENNIVITILAITYFLVLTQTYYNMANKNILTNKVTCVYAGESLHLFQPTPLVEPRQKFSRCINMCVTCWINVFNTLIHVAQCCFSQLFGLRVIGGPDLDQI